MRLVTMLRGTILLLATAVAIGCAGAPTRSRPLEVVSPHEASGRLARTDFRARFVFEEGGDIVWWKSPRGYAWQHDEAVRSASLAFYAPPPESRDNPDRLGRRIRYATITRGDEHYHLLVGDAPGAGEAVTEFEFIGWDGSIQIVDCDTLFRAIGPRRLQ